MGVQGFVRFAASEVVLADRRTFTWIIRDVTARQAAEAVRLRLERAIDSTAEAIIVTDRGGHIQCVNPAFTAVTGYREDEALGRLAKNDERKAQVVELRVFGGMTMQGLIPTRGVSWGGHFFGLLAGVLVAFLMARDSSRLPDATSAANRIEF